MEQRRSAERDGAMRMTKVATALKHPTRQKALEILNQREASPSAIAELIGEPVANVAYHVKILLRLGLVERADDRPARGAAEHVYRATAAPILLPADWEGVAPSARHQVEELLIGQAVDDWTTARDEGLLERRGDRHLSRVHLELDEQAWEELVDDLAAVLERAHARQAAARRRLAAGGAGGRRLTTTMLLAHFPSRPVA